MLASTPDMTKRLRWILRIAAWGAFLVLAPILIMMALGRRITPTTPAGEPVGTFLVRTFPRGASLFVNSLERSSRTPTAIRSLTPGTYELRIEKEGYRPWIKYLDIIGTRLTDVRDVRLYPTVIEEDILRAGVKTFSLSPRQRWLLIVESSTPKQRIRIVPAAAFTEDGIVPPLTIDPKEHIRFFWAPNEQHVALAIERTGAPSRMFVIEAATGEVIALQEIQEIVGWLPGDSDTLVFRRENTLVTRHFPEETETVLAKNVHLVGATENVVAFSSDQREDLKRTAEGVTLTIVKSATAQEVLLVPLPPEKTMRRLTPSPRGDVLIYLNDGTLLWNAAKERWEPFPMTIERPVWSPDGTKFLWQTSQFDIWAMNIHEERTVLPPLVPELLIRLSTPLSNLRWFPDSQHVLFRERDVVSVIELDGRNGHRLEPLLGTNQGDAVTEISSNSTVLISTARRNDQDVILHAFLRTPEDR